MSGKPSRFLVFYWHPDSLSDMRAAIRHHLRALESSPVGHEILYYNVMHGVPSWLRYCDFDCVVLHTTFLCLRWSTSFYKWKWKLRWLNDVTSVKVALPQDEYDHSEVLDEWLSELGVSIIFTNFDASYRKTLYPIMHDKATFYECLTGYIDDGAAKQYQHAADTCSRPFDIVYRASRLPFWFGSHGQLKHNVAEIVAERAQVHGLTCDISTRNEDTIVGDRWLHFMASGRAVIGCESGSSVLDRRGEMRGRIQALRRSRPDIEFDEVDALMPVGWDDYEFFAVSPRHFEAIMTKTCQILIEGPYNGVLEPEKHYIALKRDFSNLDEVLERLRDEQGIRTMVERAYEDIYLSGRYTYRTLATDIETALSKRQRERRKRGVKSLLAWPLARLSSHLATSRVERHARYYRLKQSIKPRLVV